VWHREDDGDHREEAGDGDGRDQAEEYDRRQGYGLDDTDRGAVRLGELQGGAEPDADNLKLPRAKEGTGEIEKRGKDDGARVSYLRGVHSAGLGASSRPARLGRRWLGILPTYRGPLGEGHGATRNVRTGSGARDDLRADNIRCSGSELRGCQGDGGRHAAGTGRTGGRGVRGTRSEGTGSR